MSTLITYTSYVPFDGYNATWSITVIHDVILQQHQQGACLARKFGIPQIGTVTLCPIYKFVLEVDEEGTMLPPVEATKEFVISQYIAKLKANNPAITTSDIVRYEIGTFNPLTPYATLVVYYNEASQTFVSVVCYMEGYIQLA